MLPAITYGTATCLNNLSGVTSRIHIKNKQFNWPTNVTQAKRMDTYKKSEMTNDI